MSKSSDYWKQRFELLLESQLNNAEEYSDELEEIYNLVIEELEKDISKWYTRFAKNNEISLSEAKKMLRGSELAEFHWDVQEYIAYGERNAINGRWMRQLENASARVHISRLESIKIQTQQVIEKLFASQSEGVDRLMRQIYQDTYYHTAFEIQSGFNVGYTLQSINETQLQQVLSKPWAADAVTFSNRIWRNKDELINTLHTELTQFVIRGDSPDKAISTIAKKLNVSRSKAGRLVMTESAFFASAAQKNAFNELDVERYEIVATLDMRTSSICQELDGKVFAMSDYAPGITAPPFHPWCRTVTVPYFDDDYGQRIARDLEGKTYYVPSNMKYGEWYQSQVEKHGQEKFATFEKKKANKQADKKEYASFKQIMGDNDPNTLDAFQEIKYNDSNEWYHLKGFKMAVEKGDIHVLTGYNTYKSVANEIRENLVGLITSDGITITNYKSHFVDRIIGQIDAGTTKEGKRTGVQIEDVKEALLNPINIKDSRNNARQYINEKVVVTINHLSGNLIQTNPKKKGVWK